MGIFQTIVDRGSQHSRGRSILRHTSALPVLALAMGIAVPAFAQNECGLPTGASVTCTSAGNPYANGITYIAPAQDFTIVLNPDVVVNTTGTFNIGVAALANPLNSITINGGTGASITTGDVGAFGVFAVTTAGNATVNIANVTTHGDNGIGVVALADTGSVIVNAGTVHTDGIGADAIYGSAGTGNVTASGLTLVTNGATADGFDLSTTGGNISATVGNSATAGTVVTNGNGSIGVSAIATAAGNVSVLGNGANGTGSSAVTTHGAGSTGVLATAANGNVLVDLATVRTTGAGSDAIIATSTAGTATVNASNVSTADGRAIAATGTTGATVTQNAGAISTIGANHPAVTVATTGGTARATLFNVSTTGATSNAVDVSSTNGNAFATVGTATTTGAGSIGVRVAGNTGASATIGTLAQTTGDNADAVDATGGAGTGSIVNNGAVRTAGLNSFGLSATGTTGANVSGTGSVTTLGTNAYGIAAVSAGPVSVNDSGAVSTAGTGAGGIVAISSGSTATVVSGAVSTTGANAVAIRARGTNASVTANGVVSRTGALGALPAAAIQVQATTGSATANVGSVTGSGTGISAVLVQGVTTASATVRSGGVVTGNVDGIGITSGTGSTVLNSGTINTGTGYAIRATGGAATIANGGTINGAVLLTANNDTILNNGVFNANGVSDLGAGNDSFINVGVFNANAGGGLNFNAGTDSFVNSGTIRILPGATTAGTTSFAGLESFNNTGLIDLRNGHSGDVFTIGGSSFTGLGTSTLGLDVQLGGATPTADRFVTGAATGNTSIVLGNLTTGVPLLNPGVVLVQAAAGSTPGAFALAGGRVTYGFVSYGLRYNAADSTYLLVGTPSQAAYRALTISEGARALWYKSADAWSEHMASLRDATWRSTGDRAAAPGSGLWMQIYGSTDTRRNGVPSFTTFGQTTATNLDYHQDAFGGQVGFDFGRPKPSGGFVFGLTGGYVSSVLGFIGSHDRVQFDTINGGAYASFVSGVLFANLLGKYDYSWIDTSLGGNSDKLKSHSYGGQGELGVRFGDHRLYFEPVVQAAYVKTHINNMVAPGFLFDFDERDGLRGKAGGRAGAAFDLGGSKGLFYASGMVLHEFRAQDSIDLTSGAQTVSFADNRIRTYGQGTLGFNITTVGGVTGFVEGFADAGRDYNGGGGRGGIRLRF